MAKRETEAASLRRESARVLLRLRAGNREIRDWLPGTVIVALTEDRVGDTFAYLDQHHPDGGHLVRVVDESLIEVMEVRRCDPQEFTRDQLAEKMPVHPDAEIGMLFDYLRNCPGQRLHCSPARPDYEVAVAMAES